MSLASTATLRFHNVLRLDFLVWIPDVKLLALSYIPV